MKYLFALASWITMLATLFISADNIVLFAMVLIAFVFLSIFLIKNEDKVEKEIDKTGLTKE